MGTFMAYDHALYVASKFPEETLLAALHKDRSKEIDKKPDANHDCVILVNTLFTMTPDCKKQMK